MDCSGLGAKRGRSVLRPLGETGASGLCHGAQRSFRTDRWRQGGEGRGGSAAVGGNVGSGLRAAQEVLWRSPGL